MNPPEERPPETAPTAEALDPELPPVVDWLRTGRRLAISLGVIGTSVVLVWAGLSLTRGAFSVRLLGELVGLGLLIAFAAEVVVVGGAAVRGLLRAGERGDRLASSDVSLLPPQLRRRR